MVCSPNAFCNGGQLCLRAHNGPVSAGQTTEIFGIGRCTGGQPGPAGFFQVLHVFPKQFVTTTLTSDLMSFGVK